MPARTIQRVEKVPQSEWLSICLECGWLGPPVDDEAVSGRMAYEHNRQRHDGAGIEPEFVDFADVEQKQLRHYRRMFCISAITAVVVLSFALYNATRGGDMFFRVFGVVLNGAIALLEAFLAGKWALRIEESRMRLLLMDTD